MWWWACGNFRVSGNVLLYQLSMKKTQWLIFKIPSTIAQYPSLPINSSQCFKDVLIQHWSELRAIDQHWLAMSSIQQYFESIPNLDFSRYWLALISIGQWSRESCIFKERFLHLVNSPLSPLSYPLLLLSHPIYRCVSRTVGSPWKHVSCPGIDITWQEVYNLTMLQSFTTPFSCSAHMVSSLENKVI